MSEKHYTAAQVNSAVHVAVQEALTGYQLQNNSATSSVRNQIAAALSGGYDFADTLHNIYLDYGYPAKLRFFNFWNMFRRFGIARRVVTLWPDQTWLDDPIVEGSEKFMRELAVLIESKALWRRTKGLDTRQRVGQYAGMFMRVNDGKAPKEPIEGKLNGLGALVDMIPLYESQLEVLETEDDVRKDEYGKPTMYQFKGGSAGSRNPDLQDTFDIHPSRIIIASEDSDNGGIYGISALEAVYNSLMDARKVIGGGGEGFYKNASQNIIFDLKDPASAKSNKALLDKFNEQYDEFSQNRSRRAMWTPGMEAKTLDSSLTNPKEFLMNALLDISAGSNTPLALLIGNQTGRMAGDQDTKGFLGQVQARRNDFGTDMVRSVIDWMMRWGVLAKEAYTVEWPDALAPTKTEKLANADKMADINQKLFLSGGDAAFSGEEIREEAGFDPEELEDLPDETLDDDDEDDLDEETE